MQPLRGGLTYLRLRVTFYFYLFYVSLLHADLKQNWPHALVPHQSTAGHSGDIEAVGDTVPAHRSLWRPAHRSLWRSSRGKAAHLTILSGHNRCLENCAALEVRWRLGNSSCHSEVGLPVRGGEQIGQRRVRWGNPAAKEQRRGGVRRDQVAPGSPGFSECFHQWVIQQKASEC